MATSLKGRIGVTLSRSRQPDEYQEALRDMEGQVDRLIRLSGDLLFLARLDHRGREVQRSEIALNDLKEHVDVRDENRLQSWIIGRTARRVEPK